MQQPAARPGAGAARRPRPGADGDEHPRHESVVKGGHGQVDARRAGNVVEEGHQPQ